MIGTGAALINEEMHLFNKDENGNINIAMTVQISTDSGQSGSGTSSTVSSEEHFNADTTYNHKYMKKRIALIF